MTSIFAVAAAAFGSFFRGKRALVLENLALRQQLAVCTTTMVSSDSSGGEGTDSAVISTAGCR